jgi:hypothetical protein
LPVVPIDSVSVEEVAANFFGVPAVVTVRTSGVDVAANFFGTPAVVMPIAIGVADSEGRSSRPRANTPARGTPCRKR